MRQKKSILLASFCKQPSSIKVTHAAKKISEHVYPKKRKFSDAGESTILDYEKSHLSLGDKRGDEKHASVTKAILARVVSRVKGDFPARSRVFLF